MRSAALDQEDCRRLLLPEVDPDGGAEEPEETRGPDRHVRCAAAPTAARLIVGLAIVAMCGVLVVFASYASPNFGHRGGAFASGTGHAVQLAAKLKISREVCAGKDEDCKGMLCCEEDGQKCYDKNESYAGCRSSCKAGEAEHGNADLGDWTCGRAKTSCACRHSCKAEGGCLAFPEVDFIYLPEVEADNERWKELRGEYDSHVPCGHNTIRRVVGVNPDLWPEGKGRYEDVEVWARGLQDLAIGSSVWVGYDEIKIEEDTPWYYKKRLLYAEVNEKHESTWALKGFKHHTGCTLTHFSVWMDARNRSLDHFIISESDGTMKQWWTPYSNGDPGEYSSVVQALLEDELPEDWDIVFLDKGTNGVIPGAEPLKQLTRECWSSPYDLYAWTGEGVAGAALYMVSRKFLDQLPQLIHDTGLDMVDAWLGSRCNPNLGGENPGGQLKCYSVKAVRLASACERVCIVGGQAISCWKRAWSKAQKGGDPESQCEDANDFVHKHCEMCADCWLDSDDCSGDGSQESSDDDQEEEGEEAAAEAHDSAACDQECDFEAQSATCGARMQYAMQEGDSACEEAFQLVRGQCGACGKCKLGACPDVQPDPDDASGGDDTEAQGAVGAADSAGCDEDCLFEGQSAACGARMRFSLGEGADCEEAFKLVRGQCSVCGRCQLSECPDLEPDSDDEPSSESEADEVVRPDGSKEAKPPESPCDVDCFWDGITATCLERITYSAGQEGGTCRKAEHLVHGQCSTCVECTVEAAGCTD